VSTVAGAAGVASGGSNGTPSEVELDEAAGVAVTGVASDAVVGVGVLARRDMVMMMMMMPRTSKIPSKAQISAPPTMERCLILQE
jgi:hypothetical protein